MNWFTELEKNYKAGTKVFLLYGNVNDIFNYGSQAGLLKRFLEETLFKDGLACSFNCSSGLKFQNGSFSGQFYEWLRLYDETEKTNYSVSGTPKDFLTILEMLRRFLSHFKESSKVENINLFVNAAEAIFPNDERTSLDRQERETLVGFIYRHAIDFSKDRLRIFLVTESLSEINRNIVGSDYICKCQIDFPDEQERGTFIRNMYGDQSSALSDIFGDIAKRTSGLNLVKIYKMLNRTVSCGEKITYESIAAEKKRIIEEFCQGLVRFKEPKAGLTLDCVATHSRAKAKLKEVVKLLRMGKESIIEKGILIPGRVGVGKSFLVDCFASECGLPVMELAEFRSKWVGDTEKQLARILLTIKSLGPVVVVVDEADVVFGNRNESGDSGVSSRVFGTLAAHIGDSSIRGKEIWIAMTSRPDHLPIDMKRQGRFGLCIPLFQALNFEETKELFSVILRTRGIKCLSDSQLDQLSGIFKYPNDSGFKEKLSFGLTGSDVEAIVIRAEERAFLDGRETVTIDDIKSAFESFIDPLDAELVATQVLAAIKSCTDKRFLPDKFFSYLK